MEKKSFFLVSCMLFSFLHVIPLNAFADMLYLKNGQQLEGLIEVEDSESVKVNVGFGKITLQKEDIDRIFRYTPQKQAKLKKELKYRYFGQPGFIPNELKTLISHFQRIEDLRDAATEAKWKKDAAAKEIDKLNSTLTKLNKRAVETDKKLSIFRVNNNLAEYNALVEKINSLQAKIRLNKHEKDNLKKTTPLLDKEISKYITELNGFRKKFAQDYLQKEADGELKHFIEIFQKKIAAMDTDFTKHSVDYDFSGSGITVKVLLNDLVMANLILDTGASLVVLSKETADKLNLSFDRAGISSYVTLADGRKVKANLTLLESIKIGELEARNVRTAILEREEDVVDDGLLGMTFLKNFMLTIDPKGEKIILEEFSPF